MMAGLALLWGFAEATLFFIVPDVLISIVVIRSGWRRGIACALIAALGAAVGGLTMYAFAAHAPDAAQAVVAAVPAIDLAMIERNGAAFAEGGYWAMLRGSAGAQHRAWPLFVLLSPLVRLPRFFLTVLLTAIGDRLAARWLTMRGRLGALIAFWVIFYAIYFVVMPH
jgi:membrane protein YqaA with SNARE-associated domain